MFSEIRFKEYKSFPSDTISSIKDIKHVNIFIGKNNSGKSGIIDVISACLDVEKTKELKPEINELSIAVPLPEETVKSVFRSDTSRGGINFREYATTFLDKNRDKNFWLDINCNKTHNNGEVEYSLSSHNDNIFRDDFQQEWDDVARKFTDITKSWVFRRLLADRDIKPELENFSKSICHSSDGVGTSILVKRYLHNGEYDDSLIEDTLLKALNEIMGSESKYERIKAKQINSNEPNNVGLFEVFLQETDNDSFALSKMGSGLKTIILVLLNLLVVPKTCCYVNKKMHYGFEELENNLHPTMQRRLFDYIYEYATKKGVYVFLTTHSHVAINSFFGKADAQFYHVTKEDNKSYIRKIENHLGTAEILDDLGVKASDLLQSNGIIWVEGPSDRIYIKRWLEIFGGSEFEEGKHYQILCYGGNLLFHYSADFTPEEETRYINMLTINRNAAVVIDSDKKQKADPIDSTKERIQQEFNKNSMTCWITSGKEVENYVPVEAINTAFQKDIKQCAPYEVFSEYTKANSIPFNKVDFANKVIKHINKNNAPILDLEDRIKELVDAIKKWNNTL